MKIETLETIKSPEEKIKQSQNLGRWALISYSKEPERAVYTGHIIETYDDFKDANTSIDVVNSDNPEPSELTNQTLLLPLIKLALLSGVSYGGKSSFIDKYGRNNVGFSEWSLRTFNEILEPDHTISLLSVLSDRYKMVIEQRYGLNGSTPKTRVELTKEIGISRTRIWQIEAKALSKMRSAWLRQMNISL